MFLDQDTIASLEGKYLRWQDGVVRELRLVSHRKENRKLPDGTPIVDNILVVIDQKLGEEKEVQADFRFMNKLAKMNHLLKDGSVIYVKPSLIGTTPKGREKFEFEVSLEPIEETQPSF